MDGICCALLALARPALQLNDATPNTLEPLFEKRGFSLVPKHRSKDVLLYRQGHINFIVASPV